MRTEYLKACPICGGTTFVPFLRCRDYTVSQETFELNQCTACTLVFTNPRPTETEIGRYYQSNAYISHSNTRQGVMARLYHLIRGIAMQRKLRLVDQLSPQKGRLLDIGCGTGTFLQTCQQAGWTVAGVEPDPGARSQAEAATSQNVKSSIWELPSSTQYQFITLWHVLEHVHQLDQTLQWIVDHLESDGRVLIAVPNRLSYDAQWYQAHWAAYDVPRHLYHFTPPTLARLAARFGLALLTTEPMPFDAYYVSMLSTQYQTGQVRYPEALRRGWLSNHKAAQNGQYSSLIYVFEKASTTTSQA